MVSVRTTGTIRVFVDSRVLFAAALSKRGPARELLVRGLKGDVELIFSDLVILETERNLATKAPEALTFFRLVQESLARSTVHAPKVRVLEAAKVVALKDAAIVAGAVHARADYLATHDQQHLLRTAQLIEEAFGVAVVTPDVVLREL